MKKHPPSISIERAGKMRREPTLAEMRMWKLLKQCFRESRFRRQIPLGHFIVDFASHGASLVIEIDGGQHDPEVDAARSRVIEAEGYSIIRFWNNEVNESLERVLSRIAEALEAHPHPLPQAGGELEGHGEP